MNKKIIISTMLLMMPLGYAMAACDAPSQVRGNDLHTLLSGNTICVPISGGGWESQEEHMSNGDLYDYKLGEGHKVDPRKLLGTWSATTNGANAAVTYVYTAFGPATTTGPYKVYLTSGTRGQNGSTYDFCDGGQVVASGILQLGTNAACQ